ncbi:hypothetical protein BDP27DRAFT_1361408 [Rhodocollybia butyracea]|uniref:Uncharacterized protein n=1 Tax=Rhodocollybia butyracea TaxID=206335 RepID=A0A9P5PTC1_9AGAR|nr:hypothetical protein BDP27DRAFT_1361408 [Rhodocollybia butyracea]
MTKTHPFFTLPPEIQTQIFTLACTPASTWGSTVGPSYLTASLTGISLSRVSKYINAVSAPVRRRAVVIYGWKAILAFEECLQSTSICTSRVRYLTLICDELPSDPTSLGIPANDTGPRCSTNRKVERLLLEVIARILRIIGDDLHELEIGFQAIEHLKDPIAYLSHSSPQSPLSFSQLQTMFYACPPSNAFPWDMNVSASAPSDVSLFPHISCPRLYELTVICNDPSTAFQSGNETQDDGPEDAGDGPREVENTQSNSTTEYDKRVPSDDSFPAPFPSLSTLTLIASTPEKALAALDEDEAAWDVGATVVINPKSLGTKTSTSVTATASEGNIWPPRELRTVVLRPKARWDERWESLADVVKRQREEEAEKEAEKDKKKNDEGAEDDGAEDAGSAKLEILVLKPGEQLGMRHC